MAILSFNPQTLNNWVNDETKLNAQNMNKIKDAIVYINDSILDKNGKGIVAEVNDLHTEVSIIKENIGSIPIDFDDKQFVVTENVVSLKSFNDAEEGSYAVKSAGELIWKKTTSTTSVDAANVVYNGSEEYISATDVETALKNTSSAVAEIHSQLSSKAPSTHEHSSDDISYSTSHDTNIHNVTNALDYLVAAVEVIDDGSID